MPLTPEFTVIVSGHGKTKSYLHRFKLIDNRMCPCTEGAQSSEHLIYDCKILESQKRNFETSNKDQRRNLAHHQQRIGSKIFKSILKIDQIDRFLQTAIAYIKALIRKHRVYIYNRHTTLNSGKFIQPPVSDILLDLNTLN